METHFKKNDECIVDITDFGNDGEGIGKVDGFTLFINEAVPGDKVQVKILKVKKNYGYAKIINIIKPSPDRTKSLCPVFSRCGGCSLQHITYEAEKKWKEKKVRDCLERIAGVDTQGKAENIITPDSFLRYRNKGQFPVGLSKDNRIITGFFAKRSHVIIDNPDCLIEKEFAEKIIKCVVTFMEEYRIEPYDEVERRGIVRHIMIRDGENTGDIMVCLVINADELPYSEKLVERLKVLEIEGFSIKSICLSINKKNTNVILGRDIKLLYGNAYIEEKLGDKIYKISPLSFFQVNSKMAVKLYDKVAEYADFSKDDIVYDLYCGTGTISLYIADKVKKVIGVEIVGPAVVNARENAKANNLQNAEFYEGAAEEVVPRLYEESGGSLKANVVIVDPPRKGCDEKLLETIIKINPQKVVYVSCNPSTLARDVKYLSNEGYSLIKYAPADMFSRTTGVETVCLLEKMK
ncbi:MAG: 23S rRNA (uracil(1939)-C(5))-methyltransferase RlmD [Lachnospiraceae bacterium]|nr:23S rRNA (uracil(1939)-C(5))-methyltransferase RlmD [Lachnospiraceae bacterium]